MPVAGPIVNERPIYASILVTKRTCYRIAEVTGEKDEKLLKHVLGHSDQNVTAIYNRYVCTSRKRVESARIFPEN
jgi:hypothetical protein